MGASLHPAHRQEYNPVGKFVKQKRLEQGISQKQLAEYAEVSYTFINRVENGDLKIQVTPLNKILNIFGYEVGAVPQPKIERLIEDLDE